MRPLPSTIASTLPKVAELFAERGLDQTKMEDVAQAAGVAKATLYYYFAGKEEILAHLLADTLRAVTDAVAIALETDGDAATRLEAVIDAQLRVMNDHPAACRALISELGRAGRIPEIVLALDSAYYAPLAQLLAEGAADGSLRQVEEVSEAAAAIFGAVTITGLHYLIQEKPIPVAAATRVSALLLQGLTEEHT
jgi:TetR/AcrR family transcriptional regulator